MGQYNNQEGGIYLVESVEDIANLPVSNNDELTFMTQTTLSIDDTIGVIEALKRNIRQFKALAKMIFVMLPPIANTQCGNWQNNHN